MKKVDIGTLTLEESRELLGELIAAMPEATLFTVLNEKLTTAQKEELGETWFNIDSE